MKDVKSLVPAAAKSSVSTKGEPLEQLDCPTKGCTQLDNCSS
jgi:hypothetical protein